MGFVGLLFALAIGLLLGLLGGGGSILALPVFVYVLGIEAKLAIAASLGVVGAASLVGAYPHHRAGNLDLRTAIVFALGSAAGALGGTTLSGFVSGTVQLVVFGVVMLTAAVTMLRHRRGPSAAGTHENRHTTRNTVRTLVRGVGVGVLTGFVGVGGGFLIVPTLVVLAGMPMRRAVGTSLLVIAINSLVAFGGYLLQPAVRRQLAELTIGPYPFVLYIGMFTATAIVGSLVGGWFARRIDPATLRRSFAIALVLMAVLILAQNAAKIAAG